MKIIQNVVLLLAVGLVWLLRGGYLDKLQNLLPGLEGGMLWPMLVIGFLLFVLVSVFNVLAVRRKINGLIKK